jgi:hypothetical protein
MINKTMSQFHKRTNGFNQPKLGFAHGIRNFPFHIWDVIRNPLTNSIIFQDVFLTTNQSLKPTIQPSFNQQPAIDPPKKEAVLGV